MAYTRFSTGNADYVLELGNHGLENYHDCYDGIDALVIETSGMRLRDVISSSYPQFRRPLQQCIENKTSLFGVDIYSDEDPYFLLRMIPILLPLLYYGYISTGEANDSVLKLCDFWNHLTPELQIVGSDAVNARKIEEHVAPLISKRIGRKPHIGLVYGAAHLGLKRDLKDKTLRDQTIAGLDSKNWKGLRSGKLNVVYEANYDGRSWQFTEHEINLF